MIGAIPSIHPESFIWKLEPDFEPPASGVWNTFLRREAIASWQEINKEQKRNIASLVDGTGHYLGTELFAISTEVKAVREKLQDRVVDNKAWIAYKVSHTQEVETGAPRTVNIGTLYRIYHMSS